MTVRIARALAGYRWRHFFPQVQNLNVAIPFYTASTGGGTMSQNYQVEYVADGSSTYLLQSPIPVAGLSSLTVFYEEIEQDNPVDIVGYYHTGQVEVPIYDNVRFTYDATTKLITFRTLHNGTWYIDPPAAGTNVRILVNASFSGDLYTPVDLTSLLIQGTSPVDSTLISAEDPTGKQIQGGYRCQLRILKRPAHGAVRIAWHNLGFEYRPDIGYYGEDSFSYFVVNSMGQESEQTGIIKLYVGVQPPT